MSLSCSVRINSQSRWNCVTFLTRPFGLDDFSQMYTLISSTRSRVTFQMETAIKILDMVMIQLVNIVAGKK